MELLKWRLWNSQDYGLYLYAAGGELDLRGALFKKRFV